MANRSGVLAIALLVVGLAVGGAVGFVVGSSQAPDVVAPAAATKAAAAATSADDPAVASKRPTRARAVDGASDSAATTAGAVTPTTGNGTITGVVRTKDGAPLPGVVVRSSPKSDDDEDEKQAGRAAPSFDLDTRTKEALAKLRHEQSTTREATTDATGAFTLTGLVDTPHTVKAWLAGWRIERADGNPWKGVKIGARCDFKATAVTAVRVKVLLPDGSPPDESRIQWDEKGGGNSGNTKCHRGETEISVVPGTYEFTATSGPQSVYRCEGQTATIAAGTQQDVTLRLASGPGVRGKIVFASADHPRHVRVAAVKVDGASPADPTRLLGDAKAKWIEDADEYALSGLDAGTYLVGLTFRGRTLGPSGTVTVGADLATLDFTVDGEPRDFVKLWVRGPDGQLVHDVDVSCGSRGPGWSGENGVEASVDPDGAYRVEHYESGAPTLGHWSSSSSGDRDTGAKREYYLVVKSAGYGSERVNYDPASDREVTVRFGAAANLRVTLTGWAESPDKDRFAMTMTPSKSDRGARWRSSTAKIDATGVAVFPPAKPAAYQIELSAEFDGGPGGSRISRDVLRMDVTLQAGDNPLTIPVPSFHDLVVTVEGAAPAEGLALERIDPSGRSEHFATMKPEAGSKDVAFDHVASGRYRVVARAAGDMLVSVPEDRRVVFRPRAFNAMRVSVDVKGHLQDAGLVEGDLVVALDGAEFENGPQMEAALASAKARESAKLSVLRAGRRLDVTVDPRRLDDGGRLAPWVR